jgi:hypothetical protein
MAAQAQLSSQCGPPSSGSPCLESGISSIELRPHILTLRFLSVLKFSTITFTSGEHGHTRHIKGTSRFKRSWSVLAKREVSQKIQDLKMTGKGKVSSNSESTVLRKRVSRKDNSDNDSEELESGPGVRDHHLTTMSSFPVPEPINALLKSVCSPNARSSSPISYGSDDENQCVSLCRLLEIMHIY